MIGLKLRFLLLVILIIISNSYSGFTQQVNPNTDINVRQIMVRIVWQPADRIQVPIKSVTARLPAALERMRANPIINSSGGKSIFSVGSNSFIYRARALNRTLVSFCAYTGSSTESELDQKLPAILQAFQEEIPVLRTFGAAFYIIPQFSEYQPLIICFGPYPLSNTLNPGSEIMSRYYSSRALFDDYLQQWNVLNKSTPPFDYKRLKEIDDKRNVLQKELVKIIAKDKNVAENPDLINRVHELYDPRSPLAIEINPKYQEWLDLINQQEVICSSVTDYFIQYSRSKGLEPIPFSIAVPTSLDTLKPMPPK